jgi:RNA polymerase sigma-70 factor (ECF subfamily)
MRLDVEPRKVFGLTVLNQTPDTELLREAQGGSTAAFETIVERHRDHVFGLALRMLNSAEDAAEVAQDTFLSAYRNLSSFRGDAQVGSWLYRIAANSALMRLRRRRIRHTVETRGDEPSFNERGSLLDTVADWKPTAENAILDAELRTAIEAAAAQLPDEQREVFVLRDLEGMAYEEIASLTGSSLAAIKSRLHRARLSLRAAIDRFYEETT